MNKLTKSEQNEIDILIQKLLINIGVLVVSENYNVDTLKTLNLAQMTRYANNTMIDYYEYIIDALTEVVNSLKLTDINASIETLSEDDSFLKDKISYELLEGLRKKGI